MKDVKEQNEFSEILNLSKEEIATLNSEELSRLNGGIDTAAVTPYTNGNSCVYCPDTYLIQDKF